MIAIQTFSNTEFQLSTREMQALLRQDFTSFIEKSFYELNPGRALALSPYIEVVAAKLEAVRTGAIKRLIINLPPRRLKSHCASIAFPAWLLGHDPRTNILCTSYGQALADEFAHSCVTLMNSRFYRGLFGKVLSRRQIGSDLRTTSGGGRQASSIGGCLTGRGADVIIIDDPQKADDMLVEGDRRRIHAWYDEVLLSRLNSWSEGAIVIVMQRLSTDDLVSHVLKHGDWEILAMPIIAQRDERYLIEGPLGRRHFTRKRGEFLDPIRDSDSQIASIKAAMSEDAFASQYLQDPGLPARMRARQMEIRQRFSQAYRSGDAPAIGRAWRELHAHDEEISTTDEEAEQGYREFCEIVEKLDKEI